MKRILSLVITSILIFGCLINCCFSAYAVNTDLFTFEITEDGMSYTLVSCDASISGDVIIPSEYKGLPVTAIGKRVDSMGWSSEAFNNCHNITSVTIPDSVESILHDCFVNCDNLVNVTMGKGLKTIGPRCFSGCESLENLYITDLAAWCSINFTYPNLEIGATGNPGTPILYAENVYVDGELLTDLVIPSGVTGIGNYAFASYKKLRSVALPLTLTGIKEYAFNNCTGLEYVFYEGDTQDWKNIYISHKNEELKNAKMHYSCFTHTLSDWTIVFEATCITIGLEQKICTQCSIVLDERTVDCTGVCTFTEEVVTAPTCSSDGEMKATCIHCGAVKNEVIPATGEHTYSDEWTVDVAPQCKTKGSESRKCIHCGNKTDVRVIPATGHTEKWMTIERPTYNSPGYEECICAVCFESINNRRIPQLKCKAPTITSISNQCDGVLIKWDVPEGADRYRIYRRGAGEKYWTYIASTTFTYYTDKKATNNAYWRYTVRAVNEGGYGDYNDGKYIKFVSTPKLTSISNETKGISIKWQNVQGATDYRIYRRGAGEGYWTYLTTVSGVSYIDASVKNNSSKYYRYTVRAVNGYFSGFDADGLVIRRLSDPVLKSAVSSSAGITTKWSSVTGATGYYVYRKTANSGWVRIGTVNGVNNTVYIDKTAKKNTTYIYTIKAFYGNTLSGCNMKGISCKDLY